MVRLPAPDRVRPVQLLVDDDARQFMRQREPAETPQTLRFAQNVVRQGLRAADRKRDVPPIHFPPPRPFRELTRRPFLAAAGQRHEARALGHRPENPRLVFDFASYIVAVDRVAAMHRLRGMYA